MNKKDVPYKYWYLEYSSDAKDNLFYCRCMGYISKEIYRSLKHNSDKEIRNFLNKIDQYNSYNYKIVKSESLERLIYNCAYHIGDVLLLNGNFDADFDLMTERIMSIAYNYLQGARENRDIILNYLKQGLYNVSYENYDSVNVRNKAIALLRNFKIK